ncbi:acyloxyacyl hydrolase [Thalassotalea nanhaiensis]|uniref:Acyloxyacyl hydrolase n=1 Tax=Thalassotalea nanhaiensis TaxID=3065648 RepID=A0ABY9TJX8_9GAMM|nr:acyloxyacyl hydrolase [Colwelliaceae bacterium SQ345]
MYKHSHHFILVGLFLSFTCCLLTPFLSHSEEMDLVSINMRASVSEETVLGKDAPENFEAYDLSANFALPWKNYSTSGWGLGTNLMASAGILRGSGENALVVSLVPELVLGTEDGRFNLDLGAGGALFSRHRFGKQDFGGPFQFTLTIGVTVPLYKKLKLGYRFLHYSDAGVNGSDTIGADLHMIMLSYRF